MRPRPAALFAMTAENVPQIFPPDVLARLGNAVEIDPTLTAENFTDPRVREALADTEILITGWGCPHIDEAVLAAAPRLRAILHAAGSVKGLTSPAVWERGITVSSAAGANALPVAEYTLAMILLAGKDLFAQRDRLRAQRAFPYGEIMPGIGNFGRRVGVVGASRIGRRLIELLRPFDLRVTLADPYVDATEAAALGVPLLPLDDLLATSDIVTVHAPQTPETHHLIGSRELALMPTGSVLVNTARGALLDHDALVEELRANRLSAILDVTDPEPLPADSPLFDLPNAFITPHLAGSQGNEVARLGLAVTEEAERLLSGRELAHAIDHAVLERTA
ncbi:hydroxyacid dehydrogenase [Streptomyces phaeochromogenes]|uniref:Hydroxyacid dehydrogenase n=1 Tax=Streptomyces phaeochromogenes TaxID=1923 RepID=A0ABZ1H9U0_STRPH|nr:hydroxyacid dehydrogenase [Streptomyces phaeochromogenes]MCX5600657.1 hydroxyacid dehydrogenase [Streptomyces phaeochromogenes]WRZ28389.1 hydroxyacid dehydrogenase [Streptomyces phaeochromogenes]WSD13969.1 hydroxyacid dehydrogenase [Streptomyces phaeochromogenes]